MRLRPTEPSPQTDAGPAVVRSELAGVRAIRAILPGYVDGLARTAGLLTARLAEGRRPELRRLAHQLRGSGGAYGFPEVTRLATAAEAAIDAGQPLERVADAVGALVELLRRVEGYDAAAESGEGTALAA